MTTGVPRSADKVTSSPFWSLSVKSGATSPTATMVSLLGSGRPETTRGRSGGREPGVERGVDALVQLGDVADELGEVGAEHGEHETRLDRGDGRGATAGAEDRPLAEEVAGPELGDLLVVLHHLGPTRLDDEEEVARA